MNNKTVLVTGATRGLGLSITKRLVTEGYQVVACGRQMSDELAGVIADHAGDASQSVRFFPLDLADHVGLYDRILSIMSHVPDLYGLVNNASVAHDGVLATLHDSEIIEMVNVNLIGTILVTKYVSRRMLARRKGRIVNVSSIMGFTGFNGLSVYGATKAALIGFTKSLARELGKRNITVNTIAPGYMETNMTAGLSEDQLDSVRRRTPLGKLVTTDDVAGSVAFLLSQDASMITGTVLTIDSGSTA